MQRVANQRLRSRGCDFERDFTASEIVQLYREGLTYPGAGRWSTRRVQYHASRLPWRVHTARGVDYLGMSIQGNPVN